MKNEEIIVHAIQSILNESEIDTNLDFRSIGINSLSFIQLVVNLEDQFDVEFDDENLDIEHYKNVKEFCCYVNTLIKREK